MKASRAAFGGQQRWQHQRGAAAIFAAVAVLAGITAFGLIYDIGLIYSAQRDLQRVANMAALDAAMATGGCADGNITDHLGVAQAQAAQSVARNGGSQATTWLGNGSVTVGEVETVGGLRRLRPADPLEEPAVQVVLQRGQPGLIMPLIRGTQNNRSLRAVGAAVAAPVAVLEVGSFAARVGGGDPSILNELFSGLLGGGPVQITALGYQGLVTAEVPFEDIIPGSETPIEEVLREPAQLVDFLQALVDGVTGTGQGTARQALEQLVAAADPALTLVPEDIISVVGDPADASDEIFLSAGNLAAAAIAAARENAPVDLGLVQEIPGLARVEVTATVLGPARIAIGSDLVDELGQSTTEAVSEQLGLNTRVALGPPGAPLLSFDVDTSAIRGQASVEDVRCAGPDQPFHEVLVNARTTAASITVRDITLDLGLLGLGAINLGDVVVDVSNQTQTPMVFGSASDPDFPQTQRAPAVSDNLAAAVTNAVADAVLTRIGDAVALPLDPLGVLQGLLNTLLSDVLGDLTGPTDLLLANVFQSLGVQVAGADVTVTEVIADRPFLFTHDG